MAAHRRTWLVRLGWVVGVLLLVVGVVAARYALQRREHRQLRDADATRAPVVAPKRASPTSVPSDLPRVSACVRGLVVDHGAPVGGMQVSVSESPPSVSSECPCARPAMSCGCREGLASVTKLGRAGLIEAVQSVTTLADGRFELCGLDADGPRLIWAEHADGRIAAPALEQSALIKPGDFVELQTVTLLPVQGLVLADQVPVPNATVLAITSPPVVLRTLKTNAQGRFEARLPRGTSTFIVAREGFSPQSVQQYFVPRQVLVLKLHAEAEFTVRALFEDKPVAGAQVALTPELPVLTDAQGVVHFAGLEAGQHRTVRITRGELIGWASFTPLEGTPRQIDVALEKGVRVRGVVVDEQGQPRRARVRGLSERKPLETDEGGTFVSELQRPRQALRPEAFAEGCADSEYRSVDVEDVDLAITLTLACAESTTGLVVDAEGKPVEGALVTLDAIGHRENVSTDATGRFRFHQPPGTYQLKVTHERYRTHEQPLQLPSKEVTVVLDAGGSISGRVVDAAGAPVVGADVTVMPAVLDEVLSQFEGGNLRAPTDAEGKFEISGLLAGRLVVSATADSMGTTVSDALVLQPGEHRDGLVLTLDEPVDVRGTVLDEQRRPLAGARVTWDPADEKSALMGVLMDAVRGRVDQVLRFMPSPGFTDSEGHYVVRGLPVSKVKLEVSISGYADGSRVAGRGETVDFTLKKAGGRVRGRVVDEGGHALGRFAVNGAAFTPSDGRFEVEVYGHEDTLSVTARGFSRQQQVVLLEGPEKDLGDIVMKRGRQLRVEVVTSDGQPLAGVRVAAAQKIDGDDCTTKADGRCVIEPLLELQTEVKATKDGFVPVSVTVAEGQVEAPLKLTLAPAGGRLTGVVFAVPGRPVAARSVFLSGAIARSVLTDAEGHFTAEGLPEGTYCASIDLPGGKNFEWAVPMQASASPSLVPLGPLAGGATLEGSRVMPGRLVLLQGEVPAQPISELLDRSASTYCETFKGTALASIVTGAFRFEGLSPGRWSLFFVSITQAEDKGTVAPTVFELMPNETKRAP